MKDWTRRLAAPVLAALALLTTAHPALAWKPIMHVYLAEQALADAIDDGRVTI